MRYAVHLFRIQTFVYVKPVPGQFLQSLLEHVRATVCARTLVRAVPQSTEP